MQSCNVNFKIYIKMMANLFRKIVIKAAEKYGRISYLLLATVA